MISDNSRIVFLGDSITQAGVKPNGYVTLFEKQIKEKFADKKIEIIGAGISGHKVPDLQKRLDRDVLSKKPTLVFIYIGINDVWHSQSGRGTSKEDFESGLRDIIKQIKDVGSKVILCTPSVIGEKTDGSNPLDSMLEEYSAISRQVAEETDSQMLDLRKKFIARLKTENPENRGKGIFTGDGVHLNPAGNKFVASQMLEAVGVSTPTVSSVKHIVLFKFNDDVKPAAIEEIVTAFGELPSKISQISGYEAGTNVSPENLDQGFTHAFVVKFKTLKDRDDYLPHPAHKEFVKLLDGKIDKVLVFDFTTE
ncbi:MAG: Dabb family protein [Mariniblastus sp.]